MTKTYRIKIKRELMNNPGLLSEIIPRKAMSAMKKTMRKLSFANPLPSVTFEEINGKIFAVLTANFK